jgi:hypothetical protein
VSFSLHLLKEAKNLSQYTYCKIQQHKISHQKFNKNTNTDSIVSIKAESCRLNCAPTVSCPLNFVPPFIFEWPNFRSTKLWPSIEVVTSPTGQKSEERKGEVDPRTRSIRSLPRESLVVEKGVIISDFV